MGGTNFQAAKRFRAEIAIAEAEAAAAASESESESESDSDSEEVAENGLILKVKLTRPTGAVTAAEPEAAAVAMETGAVATETGAEAAAAAEPEAAAAEPAARGKKRRRPRPKMSPAEAKQMLHTLGIQVRAELLQRSQELMFATTAFSVLETDQRKTERLAEQAEARAARENRLAAEKAAKKTVKETELAAAKKKRDNDKRLKKQAAEEAKQVEAAFREALKKEVAAACTLIGTVSDAHKKRVNEMESSQPVNMATIQAIRALQHHVEGTEFAKALKTVCGRMMQETTNDKVRRAVGTASRLYEAIFKLPENAFKQKPQHIVEAKAKLDEYNANAEKEKARKKAAAEAAAEAQQAALGDAAKLAAAVDAGAQEGLSLEDPEDLEL